MDLNCSRHYIQCQHWILGHLSDNFFFMFIMATNLIFVSGKKKNTKNPILDGCRFVLDRKRNDSSYWKCALLFKYLRQCDLIEEYRIENSPVMASPRWEPWLLPPVEEVERVWITLKPHTLSPLVGQVSAKFRTYCRTNVHCPCRTNAWLPQNCFLLYLKGEYSSM